MAESQKKPPDGVPDHEPLLPEGWTPQTIYGLIWPVVCSLLRYNTQQDKEDLAQEIYLAVCKSLPT